MPIYPIPEIATMGVVTDVDSVQSSIQAFTFSVNARFEDSKISRGPVASSYATMSTDPRQMLGYQDTNDVDHLIVVDNKMDLYEVGPKSQAKVSPTSDFTPADAYSPVTMCTLANVVYVNRTDMSPMYRKMTSIDAFANLSTYDSGVRDPNNSAARPNLPNNVRFKSMRSYADRLIGIGLQVGANSYPNTFYFSQPIDADYTPPANWMVNSTVSLAGQVTISDMRGQLVDGYKLGQDFILAGTREFYKLSANGDIVTEFNLTRMFDQGIMSQNCAVDHNNLLYVFGDHDVFVTNGQTAESIANGRVKNYIKYNIVNTQRHKSFVYHNEKLNEIMFCFVSSDPYCAFPYSDANPHCNRAFVYNYQAQTWYTYDLPYVTCATSINTFSGLRIIDATMSIASITGSISGLRDGASDVTCLGSNHSIAPYAAPAALRTYAIYEQQVASGVIDTFATTPCILYKNNMDCGDLTQIPGLSARLREYKLFSGVYAKGYLYHDTGPVTIRIGTCDQPSDNPVWSYPQTWTQTCSKLDYNDAGRFLSIKIQYDDFKSFRLDGLDLDITVQGKRGR